MQLDNQTSVTGAATNEYKLYLLKSLLNDKFRKMPSVPYTLWTLRITVSLADTLNPDDCKFKCYFEHASICFFYTYEAITKLCHIGDISNTESSTSITPTSVTQDLFIRNDYAVHKGCPDGYNEDVLQKCYKSSGNEKYNWGQCVAYCADDGAFLAEIQSQAELDVLSPAYTASEDHWTGLRDYMRNGS